MIESPKSEVRSPNPEIDRAMAAYRLGGEMATLLARQDRDGRWVMRRRKDREAIEQNIEAARKLGVKIEL
jgi:hypothetical protein